MSTAEVEGKTEEGQDEEKKRLALEVKIDSPSACERHVTVTVAKDDVQRYIGEALNDLMPKADLPGFRPRGAPRKLVETRFKEQITDQVKGKILMDTLGQLSDGQRFTAISEPDSKMDSVQRTDD